MKILCLLTENPVPARNGITIPTYNHLKILKSSGADLTIFIDDEVNDGLLDIGDVYHMQTLPRGGVEKVFSEFTLQNAFYDILIDIEHVLSKSLNIDAIYYSPISLGYSANKVALEIFNRTGKEIKVLASISDCYTGVLKTSISSRKSLPKVRDVINYLRSYLISNLESKVLKFADTIFVQTEKDKAWLSKIGVEGENVVILPNGVSDVLFNINSSLSTDLIFVGNFRSDYYIEKLNWFVESVFNKLLLSENNIKLHVYTSGVSHTRLDEIQINNKNIILYNGFIDDIKDVYLGKGICIAPIFKSYGFINKVAESMSSGLIVVGDESAFNGMSVENAHNCFIANDQIDFYEAICAAIKNIKNGNSIGMNAQLYAKKHFSWNSRKERVLNAIR
ncbi:MULTISPECIES: glycosyltransferase [unclassified Pseudoalteromonas]|uniref:glycosyltransferase n=1 Tax=unclassified Pseudoalteromonas TaxID=194690 RepID=UPI0004200F4E|nr:MULTISPECIES: glycosyltransferase [unclassified Pseudoalteromonas]